MIYDLLHLFKDDWNADGADPDHMTESKNEMWWTNTVLQFWKMNDTENNHKISLQIIVSSCQWIAAYR